MRNMMRIDDKKVYNLLLGHKDLNESKETTSPLIK